MTPAILPIGPSPLAAGGPAAEPGTGPDPDLFRSTLATQLASAAPAAPPVRNASATAAPKTGEASTAPTALQTKIAQMLEAGHSQAEVIAAVAATLAKVTAAKLGVAGADARKALQTVFATALAPPGDESGSTASIADRARTLAQRAEHVASIIDTVTTESGQQKRIAGNLLDAHRAKDIPAPTSTTTSDATMVLLANNLQHLATNTGDAAPAHGAGAVALPALATRVPDQNSAAVADRGAISTVPAESASPASALSALAEFASNGSTLRGAPTDASMGDGRTATSGSRPAISTGGDTALGRVLTRALVASDSATTSSVSKSADATLPTRAATSASAEAQAPNPAGGAEPKDSDATIAAFMKSFSTALSATTTGQAHPHQASTPLAMPALPTAATPAATAFVPSVAPFTIEQAQPAASAAVTAPPAPVDQSALVDQLMRGAFLRTSGDASEVRLKLVPETLGDLSVKLSVDAGNVTAHVVAETSAARDALVAAQPQLTKSLAEAGLKLTGFTVDLSGNGFAGFGQQQNGGGSSGGNRPRRISAASAVDDAADDAVVDAVPSFAPPVVAGGRSTDYNYLV